jgi:hypothetical protein
MNPEPTPPITNHAVTASARVSAGLRQAVSGVIAPQLSEARIREVRPSVLAAQSGLALLGKKLIQTVFLAPLGWLCLAPLFLKGISPFVCRRYTLTNRRLMIQTGLRPSPVEEMPLREIDEVRVDPASVDDFFRCGDLEILSKGEVKMRLSAVREPESFQRAIVNAAVAWAGKPAGPFIAASAVK